MDSEGVKIPIEVALAGTGGEDAARQLKTAQAATEAATAAAQKNAAAIGAETAAQEQLNKTLTARPATPADKAYGNDLTAGANAAVNGEATEELDARAAAEERRNSLISQRMALEEAETELLAAQASGETEKIGALQGEIEIRTEALGLQRASLLSEEEAVAVAAQRFRSREAIALQDRAQLALNNQLIAQEEAKLALEREQAAIQEQQAAAQEAQSRVYGGRGRAGSLARNFGADQGTAGAIGIGAFGGVMAVQAMEEMARKVEQLAIENAKVTDEMSKQVLSLREMAGNTTTAAGAARIADEMSKSLDALQQKIDQVKTAPEGILATLGKGTSILADSIAAWSGAMVGRDGANNPLNNWMRSLTETGGEAAEKFMKGLQPEQATAFLKVLKDANAEVQKSKDFAAKPLPEQASELQKQIDEKNRILAGTDRKTLPGEIQYTKQTEEVAKLQAQLHKVTGQMDKQAQQQQTASDKESEKQAKAEQLSHELELQIQIQEALNNDDEAGAKKIERQLEYEKELARLRAAGAAHPEEDAKKLETLRDQTDAKKAQQKQEEEAERDAEERRKQGEKQQKISDEDKIKHDEATHNTAKLARDKRDQYEDQQRKKLQDAGYSPDEVKSRLASEMHDYKLEHPGGIGGPTKHAANDELGKPESEADFKKKFDKSQPYKSPLDGPADRGLDPNYGGAPLAEGDHLRDIDKGPSDDFKTLKDNTPPPPPPAAPAAAAPAPTPAPDFSALNSGLSSVTSQLSAFGSALASATGAAGDASSTTPASATG